MVLERVNLKGSIPNFSFKKFYVGITEDTGAVLVSTNQSFKTSFLKPYNPKFYAKKAYKNIIQDKARFLLLNIADKFAQTREKFIRSLAEWETSSDVDNMFSETSNIHQGASEKANSLSSGGKRLSLNNGIFKLNNNPDANQDDNSDGDYTLN